MPRIRFTRTPKLPRDLAHLGYEAGTEVDLSDQDAERWLLRDEAEIIPDPPKPVKKAAVAPAPPAPVASPAEPTGSGPA